jgi:drug/metabolite transporter (DMT)-like permease
MIIYGSAAPIANITALDYLQVPLLAIGGWFLGERMNSWQGWAIVLGFAGALLIIRPTPAGVDPIYLAALACAAAVATSWVLTRRAEAENEPPLTLMVWGALAGAVLSSAAAIGQPWPAPSFWLLLVMICGPVGSYCGILAVRYAPLAVIAPYHYLRLPMVTALGVLLFAEIPEGMAIAGAAVIIAACVLARKPAH